MAQQLTTEILNAALENLTSKRRQIDEQIAEVRRMLGASTGGTSDTSEVRTTKRRMSAAGRRAIAEAQRRRWAEKKSASESMMAPKPTKPKRRLSAEGRRNIVAALKKRWAAKRAAASGAGKVKAKKSGAKAPVKRAKAKAATAPAESSNG